MKMKRLIKGRKSDTPLQRRQTRTGQEDLPVVMDDPRAEIRIHEAAAAGVLPLGVERKYGHDGRARVRQHGHRVPWIGSYESGWEWEKGDAHQIE